MPKRFASIIESGPTRVLLVEDDRMAMVLEQGALESLGYVVETATNGAEAYALIRENPARADIVVTDRMMPVMDGVALTRRLKRDPDTADIPIVLLTGATAQEDIESGLAAGAFYYLTKPIQNGLVASVLESATREVLRRRVAANRLLAHHSAFANIQTLRMTLSRPDEVEPVCSLLASLHTAPDRIVQGIYELVQNAVEHGLLRFGYQEKAHLLASGQWNAALEARGNDPAYAKGAVEATITRRPEGLLLAVQDPGPGFDWRSFLDVDPSRSAALNGRGIARARNHVFHQLAYNAAGNEVRALYAPERAVKW